MKMPTWDSHASMLPVVCVLIVIGLVAVCGCAITLSDNGEVSFEFRQGFTVSHRTATTDAESKATTDFKPLMDWILKLREPTTQPADTE